MKNMKTFTKISLGLRSSGRKEKTYFSTEKLLLLGAGLFALLFFSATSVHAAIRNVQSYGAVGNGTNNDTAAINSAISAMVAGDELYFPCPSAYYLVSSSLNTITQNNVVIDGQTGCGNGRVKIQTTGAGSTVMQIGINSLSATTPITAKAAELATSFQANFSAIGAVGADYVFLTELNDSLQGTVIPGQLHCSVSG